MSSKKIYKKPNRKLKKINLKIKSKDKIVYGISIRGEVNGCYFN